jgi:1,4-dihydroxy-2-naphthoate octaprenyltransferase
MNLHSVKQSFIITLIMGALLIPRTLTATNWYVDAKNGNDTYSGRSTDSAWCSLAKVNSALFYPGDSIFLRTGCNWIGQLSPQGTGAKTDPL